MESVVSRSSQSVVFEKLYETHADDTRRMAYLMTGDWALAEDLTQEAFVRVLGRFGDLRNPEALPAYLARTVVSLTKNHFRRRTLERRHVEPATLAVQDAPGVNDDLLNALRRLPVRQRAAVVLRYCEDLSEAQTAEILQTSVKAVKSLVTRGLAALREMGEVER